MKNPFVQIYTPKIKISVRQIRRLLVRVWIPVLRFPVRFRGQSRAIRLVLWGRPSCKRRTWDIRRVTHSTQLRFRPHGRMSGSLGWDEQLSIIYVYLCEPLSDTAWKTVRLLKMWFLFGFFRLRYSRSHSRWWTVFAVYCMLWCAWLCMLWCDGLYTVFYKKNLYIKKKFEKYTYMSVE